MRSPNPNDTAKMMGPLASHPPWPWIGAPGLVGWRNQGQYKSEVRCHIAFWPWLADGFFCDNDDFCTTADGDDGGNGNDDKW